MKNELKISTISMICVLCASGVPGAYGASSVRTLGGAGTYTSAASASQSGGGAGVARAGSVRVSPTTTKATTAKSSNTASTTAGRAAATSRLSLGKYLGGTTAISGGPSVHPGNGTSGPVWSAADAERINALEDSVKDLTSVLAATTEELELAKKELQEKQNALLDGEYIQIKNDEILLKVDDLAAALRGAIGSDVEIGLSDDERFIVWRSGDQSGWTDLIAIEKLVGPQGIQGEKGDKGDPGDAADMELYSTTEQMNTAIKLAIDTAKAEFVENYYTKTEIDEKLIPVSGFEKRMADLTETVEKNMQDLQAETEIVNNINTKVSQISVNEEGDIIINANQIAENSITAREIAPNSIGSVELADGAVEDVNLAPTVKKQLVGNAEGDDPNGMYVLLVTPTGERVWADLAMGDEEAVGAN